MVENKREGKSAELRIPETEERETIFEN